MNLLEKLLATIGVLAIVSYGSYEVGKKDGYDARVSDDNTIEMTIKQNHEIELKDQQDRYNDSVTKLNQKIQELSSITPTIKEKIHREVKTVPVYSECKLPSSGVQQLINSTREFNRQITTE